MTDTKRLAFSIIQFLHDQLHSGNLSSDAQESLEGNFLNGFSATRQAPLNFKGSKRNTLMLRHFFFFFLFSSPNTFHIVRGKMSTFVLQSPYKLFAGIVGFIEEFPTKLTSHKWEASGTHVETFSQSITSFWYRKLSK